jgi:hypothetical protein
MTQSSPRRTLHDFGRKMEICGPVVFRPGRADFGRFRDGFENGVDLVSTKRLRSHPQVPSVRPTMDSPDPVYRTLVVEGRCVSA